MKNKKRPHAAITLDENDELYFADDFYTVRVGKEVAYTTSLKLARKLAPRVRVFDARAKLETEESAPLSHREPTAFEVLTRLLG
jgi:hypothetical protein